MTAVRRSQSVTQETGRERWLLVTESTLSQCKFPQECMAATQEARYMSIAPISEVGSPWQEICSP